MTASVFVSPKAIDHMQDQREHSFQPTDRQLIEAVSNRMRIFALLLIGSMVVSTLATVYQTVGAGIAFPTIGFAAIFLGISALISIGIAILTLSASGTLATAARTDGKDVTPLMIALHSLTKLFAVQYWLIVIFIVILLLFIFGIVFTIFMF